MEFAVPLMTRKDWSRLDATDDWWTMDNQDCVTYAKHRMLRVTTK